MGGSFITPEERGRIHGYHECGLGVHEIARRIQRSTDAVQSVISPAPPREAKPRGPQPLRSSRDIRRIVRKACTGEYTAAQLKHECDCDCDCSARTVWRVLARVDFLVYTKMDRMLPLTPAHKATRLAWAKANVLRGPDAWASVIFSDEKRFYLDGPDGYKDYWKDLRRSRGKSALAVLVGKQSSPDYIYTVSEYILPFAHRHYGIDYVYQQDNTSIHRSHATIELFSEMEITLLEWPAWSPDLTPIEDVWAMTARSIYQGGK